MAVVVAGAVTAAVLLVAVLTWLVMATQLQGALDTALDREANRVQRLIEANADWTGEGSSNCRYAIEPACVRRISADDAVGSGRGPLQLTEAAHAVADRGTDQTRYTANDVRIIVLPTGVDEAVMVGIPTRQTDVAMQRTAIALIATGALGILLAAALGYAAATVGLRPVAELDEAVRRVRATADPRARVDLRHSDDELGRLAVSFDAMLAELAAASDAQRDFVADASHELRTPLTTLRTNVQLLTGSRRLDDATRTALSTALANEIAGMQRTIEELGELASGDETAHLKLVPDDVTETVRDRVAMASRRWEPTEFRLATPANSIAALVPEGRLGRLLDVVLDNAGKYGSGKAVDVGVRRHDENVVIVVADRGIGIPAEDRARVFDRFYRASRTRGLPGSGLGLAIAAQIVTAAGGTIVALAGPDGGTTIRIVLTAA
ncbi:MAG: HAMP domain-containing sensor histidine kinase [Thermomicrobiales bacterium]